MQAPQQFRAAGRWACARWWLSAGPGDADETRAASVQPATTSMCLIRSGQLDARAASEAILVPA